MNAGTSRFSYAEAGIELELPHDPRIPVLDAIQARGIRAVLGHAGVSASVNAVILLKHHPDRARCTLLVEGSRGRLVLKAWPDNPASLVELLQALEADGLASGSAPTVPPLRGYHSALAFVVQAWLEGPSAHELLAGGSGARAGELGAAWLRAAWASSVVAGPSRRVRDVLDDARSRAASLSEIDVELGPPATAVVELLERREPRSPTRVVLQHGTFRADQVIDLGDGPGVLDWDSFARGAAEHDAATFLAWFSYTRTGRVDSRTALEAERAFLDGLDGLDGDALAWYRAAALLKFARHAARRRKPRRLTRADELLREARALLEG
jgi:hypothetical protein